MAFKSVSISNTTAFVIGTPQSTSNTEGGRIRLTGGFLTANATTSITFQTSTGNTAVSGIFPLAANTPFVLPPSPASPGSGTRYGYLQSNKGESLQIVIAANTTVNGALEFVEVYE